MKKTNKILTELYNDKKQLLFLGFLGCISCLIEGLIPSDPNIIHATGGLIAIAGATLVGGAMAAGSANAASKRAARSAEANLL